MLTIDFLFVALADLLVSPLMTFISPNKANPVPSDSPFLTLHPSFMVNQLPLHLHTILTVYIVSRWLSCQAHDILSPGHEIKRTNVKTHFFHFPRTLCSSVRYNCLMGTIVASVAQGVAHSPADSRQIWHPGRFEKLTSAATFESSGHSPRMERIVF